jgi:preprotein translocase subunit YajC
MAISWSSIFVDTAMAQAQAAPVAQPSTWEMLIMPAGFLAIMYFFMIRPQQRKAREHQEFIAAIKAGDEVITTGGIIGRVKNVQEGFFSIEIASDTVIKVIKSEVARPTVKQAAAEKAAAPQKA